MPKSKHRRKQTPPVLGAVQQAHESHRPGKLPRAQYDPALAIQRGIEFHQRGEFEEAEQQYREVLKRQPDHFEALHFLGILRGQRGDPEKALELLSLAVKLRPNSSEANCNIGVTLVVLRRHAEALSSFDRALAAHPNYFDALYSRGVTLAALNRHQEAIESYDRALSIMPAAKVFYSRAKVLQALNRHREALSSFDQALTLKPDYAEAHADRGTTLTMLNRHDEAIRSYDRALAIKPVHADAHYRRGNVLRVLGRDEEALMSYDRALELKQDYAEALNNRGNALQALRRFPAAVTSYDRAIALRPDYTNAWYNRGILLTKLNRYAEAAVSFARVLDLDPDYKYALGDAVHARAQICDWNDCAVNRKKLDAAVGSGRLVTPFHFLAASNDLAEQLACARNFVHARYPAIALPLWNGDRYRHERIRVAYVSADFHEHAAAFLTAGLFESHNRTRFETTAISLGPDVASAMRARLQHAFERFIDVRHKSDRDIAVLLRELEIDIAVDLMGFTTNSRTGIFAHRPSPIQVNYLGYPGTMGAEYIDYILADRVVIPEEHQRYYMEKVVYLPDCYQVNDAKRQISKLTPTRTEVGLPEKGFVFCSFNNSYKITQEMFDVWMRLLRNVEGSVLWLLRSNAMVAQNLRREARIRGIAPERLVFARRVKLAEYLARYRLADLFLDTLPYNAGTTASDALWAGLPILTCVGQTFVGRMAASLLHSIGLPELITQSMQEYEALAIRLATNPALLKEAKHKLERNRLATPLFDTERFTRHIEAAYATMWSLYQHGEQPRSFTVAATTT